MSEELEDIHSKETNNQISSYRSIFKATSLFGGLKVYQIIISIIRSKFIALLLGPEGMGIAGLYQSGLDFVKAGSSFGLAQSAVRDVAEANGRNDEDKIRTVVSVIQKLVWITGLLGMLLVIVFSPLLSWVSFGSFTYLIPFAILSITLLIDQISAGKQVVLQGLRQYKYLSASTAIGVTIGLIMTIPLYYFWGLDGIVPAILVSSFINLILVRHYADKMDIEKKSLSIKEAVKSGKGMMNLGLVMCLNSILVMGCSYILKGFISQSGGISEVGLFQAGFAIVNTYVGMIFAAMSTDYYPRLAAVCNDNEKSALLINRQAVMSLLILAPIVVVALVFTPVVLELLYSEKFVAANEYVRWALFGMMFRAVSWSIGNVFIAKGESKLFTKTSISFNLLFLIDDLLWFSLLGIEGLGISFACNYCFHLVAVFILAKRKYSFSFDRQMLKLLAVLLAMTTIVLVISLNDYNAAVKYIAGSIMIILTITYSFRKMNDYMDLKGAFLSKFKNKHYDINN